MWETWRLNPEKCPYMKNTSNGTFYVRIPIAITINIESRLFRENSVEAIIAKMKNASAEELGKHIGRLQADLSSFGNMGNIGIDGMAQKMIGAGGPSIGQDLGATIGNIQNLVKATAVESDAEDGEDDDDNAETPSKRQKKGASGQEEKGTEESPNKPMVKWRNKAAFHVARTKRSQRVDHRRARGSFARQGIYNEADRGRPCVVRFTSCVESIPHKQTRLSVYVFFYVCVGDEHRPR